MEKSKHSKDLKDKKNYRILEAPKKSNLFLEDKQRHKIVVEEINKFNALVKGHRRILEAIGNL